MKRKQKKIKKKIKIKYSRVFIFLFVVIAVIIAIISFYNLKITNIYIVNEYFMNDELKEQDIIEMAGISDYPRTLLFTENKIEKNLEDNILVLDAKVNKKSFTKVYMEITENYPLFFYKTDNKTVLFDGEKIDDVYNVPTVINYVPNLKYQDLITKMGLLDKDILIRISEIKYDPSDYDDERFLLYMKDGNYVYINLYKFENLNKYIEIVKNFGNKKGIVYLDSGNYFEIIEN